MNLLKQSTAVTIKLGPFIDDTDGKTEETALTISQADIRLSKNGGNIAQTHNSAGATHDELGYYNVPLDATDTNTLGRLLVAVHESGALPVWQEFLVVTANVYDTLCSTDTFDVNVTALANDVITAAKFDESTAFPLKSADTGSTQVARVGADSDTLETLSNQLDTAQADLDNTDQYKANVSGLATASALSTISGLVDDLETRLTAARAGYLDKLNVAGTLANSSDANTYKADVSALALEATLTAIKGLGWTDETLVKIITDIAAISAGSGATAQEVWEYSTRILTAGTNIDLSSLATAANLAILDDKVDTVDTIADSIKAKTDQLTFSIANKVDASATVNPTGIATSEELAALDGKVDTVKAKTDQLAFSVPNKVDATATVDTSLVATAAALAVVDANVDTIKAKTDNLPASPAPANEYDARMTAIQTDLDNPAQYKADVSGLATTAHMQEVEDKVDIVDTVADGIKAKTDQLTFTVANKVDASATVDPTGLATSADLAVVDENIDEIKAKTDQLAFSVPNKVDATATVDTTGIATSEELELIGEKVDNIPIAPTAQQIWTHPVRTLIQPGISLETPIAGSELILYKDATNVISLSNLGDLSNRTQVWFTIKANLDMPDDESILQVTETGNLQFINQINVSDLGPDIPEVTLAVIDEGQATITISAEAGQALPVMQVTPVEWDLKVAFSDGSVIPIQIGTAYIRQTATRAIS